MRDSVVYLYCTKGARSASTVTDIFLSIVRQLAWSTKDSQIEPEI